MSMRADVLSKYFRSNFKKAAAANTLVAEFLSQAASAGELGFGSTLNLVFFMISDQLSVVIACGGGGGGAEIGDMSWPGTTICMAGVVTAVNSIVYCSGVTTVDKSARPSAASA